LDDLDPFQSGSEPFFGKLITEHCACGHKINITDSHEHTCDAACRCPGCKASIARQIRVLEED
jgi:hypothetical protein